MRMGMKTLINKQSLCSLRSRAVNSAQENLFIKLMAFLQTIKLIKLFCLKPLCQSALAADLITTLTEVSFRAV